MPSDLIGVSVYERTRESFVFHPGPVFAHVLLADEINRAGPKTQSALLEAMEEHQVTGRGETRALPRRSSSSRRRTRPTSSAPIRCPSRSSTAS
jgi:MoxR-like ATPase